MTAQSHPDEDAGQDGAGALNGVLDDLERLATGGDAFLSFGDIVQTLGARGFGPLLLILSLFLMVPIGAIPGVPAAVGLVVMGIGMQVVRGQKGLWLPQRAARLTVEARRITRAVQALRPRLQWLGRLLQRRMPVLAEGRLSLMLIGIVLMLLGGAMVFVGFVPLLPVPLALPVLVFGIGLTMRDGLVVLAGHAGLIPVLVVAWRSLSGG